MEGENQNTQNAPKKSPMGMIVALVVFVLLAGAAYMYYQNSSGLQSASTQVESDEVMEDEGVNEEDAIIEDDRESADDSMIEEATAIEVEGGAYYFKPNEIVVSKGEKVKVTFTNAGGTHDLVIDELNVKTEVINTGDTTEVEFTAPDTAGSYEFYCSVGNHRALGMVGTLTVE